VQVIEAPLVKKRKLRKMADPSVPATKPAAPVNEPSAKVIKTASLVAKVVNVAGLLVARRKQALPPTVPRMVDVEAFLVNEPVLVEPVNVVKPVAEGPLRAPEGPIPSILNHPLGLNIQHILEDLDLELEESIGMADDNMGPSVAAIAKTLQRSLSPIPEARASSRAPTPKRPRSPTHAGVDKASGLKRTRAFEALEASDSKSLADIQPEGANLMIGERLAKLGGDLKGNLVKVMLDLVDHDKLQMNWNLSTRGMVEEMLTMQFLVKCSIFRLLSFSCSFPF
jgi:hypothetical protein